MMDGSGKQTDRSALSAHHSPLFYRKNTKTPAKQALKTKK